MALFFGDTTDLQCKKCGDRAFYERPVYRYENRNGYLEAHFLGVHLTCIECGERILSDAPGTFTTITIPTDKEGIVHGKYTSVQR